MLEKILQESVTSIGKNKLARDLIESQFSKNKPILTLLLIIYVVFYFAPFIMQIFWHQDICVFMFLMSCMFTQLLFYIIELTQIRENGYGYFTDSWNYVDQINFWMYTWHFVNRMQYICGFKKVHKYMIKMGHVHFYEITSPISHFVLIMLSAMKLLFFLRIYDEFGLLVQIMNDVTYNLRYFVGFTLFWIFIFSLSMKAMNANFDSKEYPNIPEFIKLMLVTLSTSLGDL